MTDPHYVLFILMQLEPHICINIWNSIYEIAAMSFYDCITYHLAGNYWTNSYASILIGFNHQSNKQDVISRQCGRDIRHGQSAAFLTQLRQIVVASYCCLHVMSILALIIPDTMISISLKHVLARIIWIDNIHTTGDANMAKPDTVCGAL